MESQDILLKRLLSSTVPSELTVLASSRAIISGKLQPATIVLSKTTGKIVETFNSVLSQASFPSEINYADHSPRVLMPGLVDAHVHLNEPGRTEWEGFNTGTQAAAFGGVTTVIDMPLNSIPPTTTVSNFKEKLKAAEGQCWVDVGFYGGIIPGNAPDLKALVKEGVRGFKGFLIESGVDEFPAVASSDIQKAMAELADESTTLMFHAEMVPPEPRNDSSVEAQGGPDTSYSTFLASRPSEYETTAIQEILSLSHLAPNLHLHIVHLSAAKAIPLLRKANADGIKITAETCFHYLSLAAEEVREGDTRYKCCPPIREGANQDQLWDELLRFEADGVITTVVSDHSPCTPDLKLLPAHIPGNTASTESDKNGGNFLTAWGGISSVGLGLPILWTEINRRFKTSESSARDSFLQNIVQWCCINTARQVGLGTEKGDLAVGYDADICIFDDEAKWTVQPSTMLFRNKCSPYQGRELKGLVKETWLRGQRVFSREEGFDRKTPEGKLLLSPRVK